QWPRYYTPAARRGVCAAYSAMIENGWRRQNLLGDYHFHPDANTLTEAGKLKVQWILTQAPPGRREVFVERDLDQSVTAQRIAAVQDWGAQASLSADGIRVRDTHIVSEGH